MSTEFNPVTLDLQGKVAELSTMLLDKHPRMPVLLQEIHRTLKQYPEQVTLLPEEDVATIVAGLMKQTGVEFAKATVKGTGAAAAAKNIKANAAAALGLD